MKAHSLLIYRPTLVADLFKSRLLFVGLGHVARDQLFRFSGGSQCLDVFAQPLLVLRNLGRLRADFLQLFLSCRNAALEIYDLFESRAGLYLKNEAIRITPTRNCLVLMHVRAIGGSRKG